MRKPLRSELARRLVDLAIDLGDPGRMARARRLDRGRHVGTLQIGSGLLAATVHGDEPFDAVLRLAVDRVWDGSVPDASAIDEATCTCGATPQPCQHGLAVILTFAAEVEVEPGVLDEWTTVADEPGPKPVETADEQFLRGDWTGEDQVTALEPAPAGTGVLSVDGVDAWPVIRDAIETAARQRRERAPLPR